MKRFQFIYLSSVVSLTLVACQTTSETPIKSSDVDIVKNQTGGAKVTVDGNSFEIPKAAFDIGKHIEIVGDNKIEVERVSNN